MTSETAKEQAGIYSSHMMLGQTAPASAPGMKERRGGEGSLRGRGEIVVPLWRCWRRRSGASVVTLINRWSNKEHWRPVTRLLSGSFNNKWAAGE